MEGFRSYVLSLAVVVATILAAPVAVETQAPADTRIDRSRRAAMLTPWTGDFDGMVKRRVIRLLTPYSRTHYFIDKGQPRGIAYESGVKLEEEINARLKTTLENRIFVAFVPTSRDQLYQALVDGRGDIIAASITITPEREKLVDFTEPVRTQNVREILVTGPGAAIVNSLDDLSGKIVGVRVPGIYHDSLVMLNADLARRGKAPVGIRRLPGTLEDDDILEMVNAGLVTATVVDDFTAKFWSQVFPDIRPHENVVLRDGARLAWVVRKNSPKLLAALNPIVLANRQGTAFGNTVSRKYLQNVKYVRNATSDAEMRKFRTLIELFRKYGERYQMDFLLMMAQGYQESRLDHAAKSHVGAIGVMQIMPATGAELGVGDIRQVEANINGGVKYMRRLIDTYFKDDRMDPLNKGLMAFASYNAGPGRIRSLRQEAAERGLDPNVWFNNVERVVAERVGRETVTYVSNIYKYYIAYTLTMEELRAKESAKQGVGK